ncbi:NYN domain-containing protein [Terrihabitans rhizophilus]|jgi:uncharacterized LabA/DUF88 family protein|uniref:NYN domain-containing protein n=1 Tax=Terrihabitans rhizophilus TaxID=3092662 RepID=A0ABU4RRC9_9HYPH|nr:NYN domain-containing protein [Terrihabitans sp. PJ23]MDX6806649.1 NYN domain-containing protein [Terrihabitans sp. PJ23]
MNQTPPRIALFIDGANFYSSVKALGFDVDFRKLLTEFGSRGSLLRAYYYTAVTDDQEHSSLRPLIDWLDYNGYAVVTKPLKEYTDCATGRRKLKGRMDVELTVDALELAGRLDQIFLFSGHGDFQALVAALQRKAVRVTVVSTVATQPAMAADCLRRQADEFIDLSDLMGRIGRPQAERQAPDRLPRFIRGPVVEDDVEA